MINGTSVGRLAGVEIKVNSSVLIIGALITFMLGFRQLPYVVPNQGLLVYLIGGILAAILFLYSILWHEMAHVLVAQYFRLPVIQVVLHLFGGVAMLGREPERPRQEFLIALAGPISSLVLAIVFGTFARVGGTAGAVAAWLTQVNFLLAMFNLLPGFPLDGGRVLRALLWLRTNSYRRATRIAARTGRVMAALFGVTAVLILFRGGTIIESLWLIMIGVYLYQAATQTLKATPAPPPPGKIGTVRRAMRQRIEAVTPAMPLPIMAWKYLDTYKDQAFPVLENGQLVGIVTLADAERIPRLEWGSVKVRDVMQERANLFIARPEQLITDAIVQFDATHTNHAPVLENEQFIGMLNRRDIVVKL